MPRPPTDPIKVKRLRDLIAQRIPYRKAAAIVGISPRTALHYGKGITPHAKSIRKLQPDEIELLQAYLVCGYTTTETADLTGMSTHSMSRHAPGFSRLCKVRRKPSLSPLLVHQWRMRRRARAALSEIAAEFGVTRQTVAKYTADIKIRAACPATYDRERIVELAAKGLSDNQIAARIGCSPALSWHYRQDLAA